MVVANYLPQHYVNAVQLLMNVNVISVYLLIMYLKRVCAKAEKCPARIPLRSPGGEMLQQLFLSSRWI